MCILPEYDRYGRFLPVYTLDFQFPFLASPAIFIKLHSFPHNWHFFFFSWLYSPFASFASHADYCLLTQARVLDSVGWERVDIFNPDGLAPHKDLVVVNEWLNGHGTDIVRHLVDNAPNKPPQESNDRRGSTAESEGEREETVVQDLISGLDDDSA